MKPKLTISSPVREFVAATPALESRNYSTACNRFGVFLGRDALLSDLTADNYEAFAKWMAAEKPWSVRQCFDTRYRLKHVWANAHERGLACDDPAQVVKGRGPGRPQAKVPDQTPAEEVPNSLAAWFAKVYRPLRLRTRSDNTVRLYESSLRSFSTALMRHATLDDFSDETVSAALLTLRERGLAPHSVEKIRCQLLAMWRFACRKNVIKLWPDVQSENLPFKTPVAWLGDDLTALWKAIDEQTGLMGGVPAAAWWRALHYVLIFSAERIGALWELTWDQYDANNGWINFTAESRKGGKADNSVLLPPDAMAALEAIREPKRELIFPRDCVASQVYDRYKKILKAAGLATDRRSKFHRMRKTAASFAESVSPGSATAFLRHTSRKTTLSYIDPRICPPVSGADLLGDMVRRRFKLE